MANSITTPESDESEQQESEFRASEYGRQEGDGDQAEIQPSSEDETAYRPNTEAFDAGADIWAMLSVIQRD